MEKLARLKVSDIRAFLLRFAEKRKVRIEEYVSDNEWEPISYFCHWQSSCGDPKKTSTSISHASPDDALVMAALSYLDPECNFLP